MDTTTDLLFVTNLFKGMSVMDSLFSFIEEQNKLQQQQQQQGRVTFKNVTLTTDDKRTTTNSIKRRSRRNNSLRNNNYHLHSSPYRKKRKRSQNSSHTSEKIFFYDDLKSSYLKDKIHPIFIKGSLTDEIFKSSDCCIILSVCSIATKYNFLRPVYDAYPYGNVISSRHKCSIRRVAIRKHRLETGSVVFCEVLRENLPLIANMVTQFGYGREYVNNTNSQAFVAMLKQNNNDEDNRHLIQGLMSDSLDQRKIKFKECLDRIYDTLASRPGIKRVVFPLGIACGGIGNRIFVDYFYATIIEFTMCCKWFLNKEVFVTYPECASLPDELKVAAAAAVMM